MAYDERLAARLRDHLAGEPGLSEQRMFGGLAFLVHGNMAVAASAEGGLLLRVDPDRTEELLAEPHTDPFVMRGRRMAGWMRVLPEGLGSDADLARWAGLGVEHARRLPPK
jgi:TfoX/Sxy family transcriptional regulator of competence genes